MKKIKITSLLLSLLMLNCSKNELEDVQQIDFNRKKESVDSRLVTIKLNDQLVTVEDDGDQYILQGDIVIKKDDLLPKIQEKNSTYSKKTLNIDDSDIQSGVVVPDIEVKNQRRGILLKTRWPDSKVPFVIDGVLPTDVQNRIWDAIRHIELSSNLRFNIRNSERGYIYFKAHTDQTRNVSNSEVGYKNRRQNINLNLAHGRGVIVHEILHALGFWHEHTRPDRDDHVRILWDNIRDRSENGHNFEIARRSVQLTDNFDFNSIMMYGSGFFTVPGTFRFNDPNTFTIQRITPDPITGLRINVNQTNLSDGDIESLIKAYGNPTPVISNTGSGCNDLKCIWITGRFNRDYSTRIELRKTDGNREIIGTYRTGEFDFHNDEHITLRLKRDNELNEFTNKGLRVYVVNEDFGTRSNYADNIVTNRNVPIPIITNSGSGCDDKRCIWIESKNYEINDSMRVEIRNGSTWEIISTYRGNDLNYTNFGITLRLKTNNEVNIFQNNGLRVFLVNERYGTFSSYGGNHITRR